MKIHAHNFYKPCSSESSKFLHVCDREKESPLCVISQCITCLPLSTVSIPISLPHPFPLQVRSFASTLYFPSSLLQHYCITTLSQVKFWISAESYPPIFPSTLCIPSSLPRQLHHHRPIFRSKRCVREPDSSPCTY